MVTDCTPWSDIKCVDRESGALTHGEAPVSGEPATVSQRLPITPSPSAGPSGQVIGIVTGVGIIIVLIACVVWCSCKGEVLEGKEEVLAPSLISPDPPVPPGLSLILFPRKPLPPHLVLQNRDHIGPPADGPLFPLAKSGGRRQEKRVVQ